MSQLIIRRAVEADATKLVRLTAQSGYPASAAALRARLLRMMGSSKDCFLVVEDSGGGFAGWIHGFLSQLLESEYRVEIGGLLVDELRRRSGIGRRWVRAVEDWAVERSAIELSVRCRVERVEFHKFYEGLSFRQTKHQRVFRRRVANME